MDIDYQSHGPDQLLLRVPENEFFSNVVIGLNTIHPSEPTHVVLVTHSSALIQIMERLQSMEICHRRAPPLLLCTEGTLGFVYPQSHTTGDIVTCTPLNYYSNYNYLAHRLVFTPLPSGHEIGGCYWRIHFNSISKCLTIVGPSISAWGGPLRLCRSVQPSDMAGSDVVLTWEPPSTLTAESAFTQTMPALTRRVITSLSEHKDVILSTSPSL
eukprot:PhF_6_TR30586/c0_g1_i1/m.44993